MKHLNSFLWLLILCRCGSAQILPSPLVADPVFDVAVLRATPLEAQVLKRTVEDGIVTEEITYYSHHDGDKKITIFGLFCYPEGAQNAPAYIWNQGGLGQATTHWLTSGARRGYAALCIDFPMPGYRSTGGYPIVSGLELGADPRQAPIYHGAVALLKAVTYLQSRPEVDPAKIGMAGMSWGGFYTTLMAGLDDRLKVGSSMFGCGGLQSGNIWWDGMGWDEKRDAAFRERWRVTLDPAQRLRRRQVPMAWFTGTNDWFYWMPALMQSHAANAGPRHLGLIANWDHAFPGSFARATFTWLDIYLKGEEPFLEVTPLQVQRRGRRLEAVWTYRGSRRFESAHLMVSPGEAGNWPGRIWTRVPVVTEKNQCRAELPLWPVPYFIGGNVLDENGNPSSTPLFRVDVRAYGLQPRQMELGYDGCSEWGGFEPAQLRYIAEHALPVPKVTDEAYRGSKAAAYSAGEWKLPYVYAALGLPHTLKLWIRSKAPADITLKIGGRFDKRIVDIAHKVKTDTRWAEVRVPFTPPEALLARFQPVLQVPEGVDIEVDEVSFRPHTLSAKREERETR